MSLIGDFTHECEMMTAAQSSDGAGGQRTAWTPGVRFRAAIVRQSATEPKTAEKQRAKSIYRVTIPSCAVELKHHDVFRRISDGKVFRVTEDSDDVRTPARASFQFSQISAEEWRLTE